MISGGRHSTDHLPAELVKNGRIVFDQLSPSGSPIHYHQFAVRWPEYQRRDSSTNRLPVTFLDCLRRVTPPNGMLTFERFCAGLRLAVAEERENTASSNTNSGTNNYQQQQKQSRAVFGRGQGQPQQQAEQPLIAPAPPARGSESIEKTKQLMKTVYGSSQSMTTAANGQSKMNQPPPYNVALSRSKQNLQSIDQQQQRHHHHRNRIIGANDLSKMNGQHALTRSTPHLCSSDKRASNGSVGAVNGHFVHQTPPPSSNGMITAAHSNVIAALRNGHHHQQQQQQHRLMSSGSSRPSSAQSTDTNGSLEGIRFRDKSSSVVAANGGLGQRGASSREDTRRHTIMEGMTAETNSSSSRHMLLMKEEKGLLKKAADTASRLQQWFNERLSSLETREKLLGKSMIPLDVAVHEEKLNYLRAHITELNRRAVALMESSEKGFPWHMNLELHRNIPQPADDQLMWLKRQNKMLTDEVSEKCERITQLEREKVQLVEHLRRDSSSSSAVAQYSSNFNNNNNGPFVSNGWSSGGADSGFHSLSNNTNNNDHSPPYRPPPNHPGLVVVDGDKHRCPPSTNAAVYAAPIVAKKEKRLNNKNNNESSPHSKRVYAELHNPPALPASTTNSPRNGVLATLM